MAGTHPARPLELALFRTAATWTAIGLAGGVAYREITRAQGFTGHTQLAVVHTHALVLGALVPLIALLAARVFDLGSPADRWFVPVWNVGLAVTVGMLTTKGLLQVLSPESADSAALAGVAGLGHITLAAGLVLLLLALGRSLRAAPPASTHEGGSQK